MPTYRYAFDAEGHIADALELPADHALHNGPFACAGCGNQVIAKTKGEHRVKHFAHKARVECNEETYLHRLAKRTFREVYTDCLDHGEPFLIELRHRATCDRHADVFATPCDGGTVWRDHDLTRYYDGIKEEQRDGEFIPDLLLYNTTGKNGTVYIEMAVTHELSEKKWESGQRIIELKIKHAGDIAHIREKRLGRGDGLFLNFAAKPVTLTAAECDCAARRYCCLMPHITLDTLAGDRLQRGDHLTYVRVHDSRYAYPPEPGDLFRQMVEDAHKEGVRLKNCYLCRYQGDNWLRERRKPIYCKLRKMTGNSNEAVSCPKFWPRDDLLTSPRTDSGI